MSRRDYMLGLMAASIYEPLSPEEAQELEQWLEANPEQRTELEAMRELVDFMPEEAPAFTGNLLPAVREDLRHGKGSAFEWAMVPRFALQIAGTLVVTAVLVLPLMQGMQMGFLRNAPLPQQQTAAGPPEQSLWDDAQALIARQEHEEAYELLEDALATQATHRDAGHWQLLLAQLEYDHFQRYDAAFDRYTQVKRDHPAVFTSDRDTPYRYDLLEQTASEDFAPLYTIDRAREQGMDSFKKLEDIYARYAGPANPVSQLALATMSDLVGALPGDSPTFKMATYEKLRRECSDPVALDQIEVALGKMYVDHGPDCQQAQDLLRAAAGSPNEAVSREAQVTLASLGAQ